jgi:succinylglutamate desuccinylase/ribosomal protein S18 acetylase RimI-like enzyme
MYQIVVVDDKNKEIYKEGFIKVYQKVFSESPYFEKWTFNEVSDIFDKLTSNHSVCLVLVTKENNKVVGLSGSLVLGSCSEELQNILTPVFGKNVLYNAELAILEEHRHQGFAKDMINKRIEIAINDGFDYICMRTVKDNSMSQRIYESFGFTVLDDITQSVSQDRIDDENNHQDERIFLYKKVAKSKSIEKDDSIIKIDSGINGPTLAIFAGVHGDEVCGVEAFQKIIPEIKITKGVVYFVYANLNAIKENVRFTESNLNRCFGKDDDLHIQAVKGSYERERALELMLILDKCDALLDIHASTNVNSTPFIICEPHSFDIAKILPGFPIRSYGWDIIEKGGTDYYMNNVKTLSGDNGNGICIECGYLGDPAGQKRAENGLLAFLKYFDVIDEDISLIENKNQREINAYKIHITKNDFTKSREFADFELLKNGDLIGIDGDEDILAENNNVIIFPTNKTTSGEEAFILGVENIN